MILAFMCCPSVSKSGYTDYQQPMGYSPPGRPNTLNYPFGTKHGYAGYPVLPGHTFADGIKSMSTNLFRPSLASSAFKMPLFGDGFSYGKPYMPAGSFPAIPSTTATMPSTVITSQPSVTTSAAPIVTPTDSNVSSPFGGGRHYWKPNMYLPSIHMYTPGPGQLPSVPNYYPSASSRAGHGFRPIDGKYGKRKDYGVQSQLIPTSTTASVGSSGVLPQPQFTASDYHPKSSFGGSFVGGGFPDGFQLPGNGAAIGTQFAQTPAARSQHYQKTKDYDKFGGFGFAQRVPSSYNPFDSKGSSLIHQHGLREQQRASHHLTPKQMQTSSYMPDQLGIHSNMVGGQSRFLQHYPHYNLPYYGYPQSFLNKPKGK